MNYSNQRWVKLYCEQSTSMLLSSWDARALFRALLTVVDREGRLDLGVCPDDSKIPFLLSIRTGNYGCETECASYSELVKSESIILEKAGEKVVVLLPNFVEAQRSHKGEAQRKREYREARSVVPDPGQDVPETGQRVPKKDRTVRIWDHVSRNVPTLSQIRDKMSPNRIDKNKFEETDPDPIAIAMERRPGADAEDGASLSPGEPESLASQHDAPSTALEAPSRSRMGKDGSVVVREPTNEARAIYARAGAVWTAWCATWMPGVARPIVDKATKGHLLSLAREHEEADLVAVVRLTRDDPLWEARPGQEQRIPQCRQALTHERVAQYLSKAAARSSKAERSRASVARQVAEERDGPVMIQELGIRKISTIRRTPEEIAAYERARSELV